MVRLFDELIDLSHQFVELNNGRWDNAAWLEFLSQVQRKGFKINSDMQEYIGYVLEALKQYHQALASSTSVEGSINDITDKTVEFIKKTRGKWDYSAWEQFLNDLNGMGCKLNEETVYYLNGVLDAVKKIYAYSFW